MQFALLSATSVSACSLRYSVDWSTPNWVWACSEDILAAADMHTAIISAVLDTELLVPLSTFSQNESNIRLKDGMCKM
jgi:hypothetical protein